MMGDYIKVAVVNSVPILRKRYKHKGTLHIETLWPKIKDKVLFDINSA